MKNFVDEDGYFELKRLNEYSDDELYEILCSNYNVKLETLAGVCSEVLRRMIHNQKHQL